MIIIESHIVPDGNYNIRIQEYAGSVFKNLQSRSAVKKAITKKRLLINGKPALTKDWIIEGQHLELLKDQSNNSKIFKLKLNVIYEDDNMAAVYKLSGYPTNGNYYKTIENALPFNLKTSKSKDALPYPTPIHRLDNPTSGILLIAKTKTAQLHLHKQFEQNTIRKTYFAVVAGKPDIKGEIDFNIEHKSAYTSYETLSSVNSIQNQHLSLVKLYPKTGRTHQLRIHLAKSGFPIIGDKLYAPDNVMKHKGLFLCAGEIHFIHPISKTKTTLKVDIPSKFKSYLNRENNRFKKYN